MIINDKGRITYYNIILLNVFLIQLKSNLHTFNYSLIKSNSKSETGGYP